jgi:hypothetical protein
MPPRQSPAAILRGYRAAVLSARFWGDSDRKFRGAAEVCSCLEHGKEIAGHAGYGPAEEFREFERLL